MKPDLAQTVLDRIAFLVDRRAYGSPEDILHEIGQLMRAYITYKNAEHRLYHDMSRP